MQSKDKNTPNGATCYDQIVELTRLLEVTHTTWETQLETELGRWLDQNDPINGDSIPEILRINQKNRISALFARSVIVGVCSLNACFRVIARLVDVCKQDGITVDMWGLEVVGAIEFSLANGSGQALHPRWDEDLDASLKEKYQIKFGEDDVCQDIKQIIAKFDLETEGLTAPDSKEFGDAITRAFTRVAGNGSLHSSEIGCLKQRIFLRSGRVYSLSVLNARLKEIRKVRLSGEYQQEIVSSIVRVREQSGELRHHAHSFWEYTGPCWEKVEFHSIFDQIALEYGHLASARKYNDLGQIRALLATNVAKPLKAPSAPSGINFSNGLLTEKGQLLDHSPDHGMTYYLPFRYRPELAGEMPLFHGFLKACWGQDPDYKEKVASLQEFAGITMMGKGPRFQRAILLYGSESSGTRQLVNLMEALLPPRAKATVSAKGFRDDYLPERLAGKLLNSGGELTGKIADDVFKMLVDGSPMTVERKNKDPYTMVPTATHWFSSGGLPRSDDWSDAFSRRWAILQFNQNTLSSPHTIQEIIEQEVEAIVGWAIEGFFRACDAGITLPASHHECVKEMRQNISPLYWYLKDSEVVRVGREQTDTATDATSLLHDYWNFCRGMGIRNRLSMPEFLNKMRLFTAEMDFEILKEGKKIFFKHIELDYELS